MRDLEIIFNLWYVFCDDGLIYSLRARPYIKAGREKQKLKFLKGTAERDYLIAQPFPVPKRSHTTIVGRWFKKKMPVFPMNLLDIQGGPITTVSLFEEVFRQLEKQLPAQTKLKVPQDPLFCVTPLLGGENREIKPKIDGVYHP